MFSCKVYDSKVSSFTFLMSLRLEDPSFICCIPARGRDSLLDHIIEQMKPIGDAVPIYEELVSTFPTSVPFSNFALLLLCPLKRKKRVQFLLRLETNIKH